MASLRYNIIANYVGRTWTAILSIIFIPLYLKFMGIEAYGLMGFYMALSNVLGLLDLGIGATMNRELARLSANEDSAGAQRNVVRTLEVIYWGIAICAGVGIILLAPYIAHTWIKAQNLPQVSILNTVQLMGVAVALQFPLSLYQGGLMGLQRQVLVNVIFITTGTFRSLGAVLVLWLVSPTIEAFFAWQVISSIVGCGVFLVAMWSSLPKNLEPARFTGHILYGVWKYATAISANSIIGVVIAQLPNVILSRMLTLKMFGYYSLSTTVASAIWMVIVPFNNAVFPRFVQLHEINQSQELRLLFHRCSQVLSLALLPVCALIIVFSREILFLWIQNPEVVENCHLIVSLLVLGTMLNGIASIPGYSASAFGWPQLITYTNAIQAVAIIPLIVAMVYWLQGVGAAIAWVVLNTTYVFFMVPFYFRRYLQEEQGSWYWRDITVPLLVAFSISLVASLIAPAMNNRLIIAEWLTVTGIIATVATGLTLPHVRSLVYSWCRQFNPGVRPKSEDIVPPEISSP